MKLDAVWVVYDPTSLSEEADIVSKCTPETLCHLIIGMHAIGRGTRIPMRPIASGFVLYTEEQEAREDARARLHARDVALRGPSTVQ